MLFLSAMSDLIDSEVVNLEWKREKSWRSFKGRVFMLSRKGIFFR